MAVWEDFKAQGNEAFRAGNFTEAIRTYTYAITTALVTSTSSEIRATLFSNRSAAFLKIASYQYARCDAEDALRFAPSDRKARFRLASALLHLRSYKKAQDVLRPMQSLTNNDDIQELIRQVSVCAEENRTGQYDIPAILKEERHSRHLVHADYCSRALEVRRSTLYGGEGGRGMFAKAVIPQGTLLVASKAIACGYSDDFNNPEWPTQLKILSTVGESPTAPVLNRLAVMLEQGCGRAILDIEGGVNLTPNLDLWRDDVYDEEEKVPQVSLDLLANLVYRNAFYFKKPIPKGAVDGFAVFHVPSFFNHSCMANTIPYHIGDMIFIVSSTTISKESEIFINYCPSDGEKTVEERNKNLQERTGGFLCRCILCQFERENASIVDPAAKLVTNTLERAWKAGVTDIPSVQELKQARRYLFKQFNLEPIPAPNSFKIGMFRGGSPHQHSFGRLLILVLRKLQSVLRAQRRYDESIPYLTEIQALIKEDLHFVSVLPLSAPNFALDVWIHHYGESDPEMASFWLDELKCICSLVAGKKFFEGNFLSLVDAEIARHAGKESSET